MLGNLDKYFYKLYIFKIYTIYNYNGCKSNSFII